MDRVGTGVYRESNMADDMTLGEVARLIERNHNETRLDFEEINKRLDREYQTLSSQISRAVQVDVYVSDKKAAEDRMARIEADAAAYRATVRWTIGLAISSFLAVIGMLIQVLSG